MRRAQAQFPARSAGTRWATTCLPVEEVLSVLDRPPFRSENTHTRWQRRSGARAVLTWLSGFPGESWQERWEASPAAVGPQRWAEEGHTWIRTAADVRWNSAQSGLLMLAGADVLRLPLSWQFGYRTVHLRQLVERTRDPEGLARLEEIVDPSRWASVGGGRARLALTRIMLAKGGGLADITAGDAFEYATELRKPDVGKARSTLFYSWLRDLGKPAVRRPGDPSISPPGHRTAQLRAARRPSRRGLRADSSAADRLPGRRRVQDQPDRHQVARPAGESRLSSPTEGAVKTGRNGFSRSHSPTPMCPRDTA